MDWSGWAPFGFAATLALTAVMTGAQMGGLSRMDIPFMLGTMVSAKPDTARVAGFFMHLLNGQFFALFYAAAFDVLDRDAWWLGAGFGAFHGLVALLVLVPLLPGVHRRMASERAGPELTAKLEPPGFLGLNYGRETAAVTLVAHVLYGALLAVFLTLVPLCARAQLTRKLTRERVLGKASSRLGRRDGNRRRDGAVPCLPGPLSREPRSDGGGAPAEGAQHEGQDRGVRAGQRRGGGHGLTRRSAPPAPG